MAARLHAGTVMVNDVLSCFGISEAPHGGMKASGIGRAHGRFGLEEMVRIKYLSSERMPGIKKVWWYGYGADLLEQMQGYSDFLFAGMIRKVAGGLKVLAAFRRKNRV